MSGAPRAQRGMLPGREVLEGLTHYDLVVTYVRAMVERAMVERTTLHYPP